jgi:RimJ/RimL family protein N-acetyltransferase
VIDFAFLHQGHQRLSFTCRVTNTGGRRLIEKCGFQPVAQELCPSAYFRAVVPVDRFTLDRSTWDGLRRWGPLRVTAGAVADGG